MRPQITRIGHTGLAVRDLDRAIAFYTEVLGLHLVERAQYHDEVGHGVTAAAGAFLRIDTAHHNISLFQLKDDQDTSVQSPFGLHHLAFELPSFGDLLQLYRNLKAAGIPIVNARQGGPGNQPRFYARDPDGNLLEFHWGMDQIGWDNKPRPFPPIEQIDLEDFDVEAFVAARDRDSGRTPMAPAG